MDGRCALFCTKFLDFLSENCHHLVRKVSQSLEMSGTKLFRPIRMVVEHFFVPNFLNFSLKIVLLSVSVSQTLDMSGTKLFQSIRRASALFCTKFETDQSTERRMTSVIESSLRAK